MKKQKLFDQNLILGGCGFIGSHLIEKIYHKSRLKIIDRLDFQNKIIIKSKNIKIYKKDIIELKNLIKFGKNCKFIFHLAANVGVDNVGKNPIKTMSEEFKILENVIKTMRVNNIKNLIFMSSSAVYGKVNFNKSVNEDTVVSPESSYAIAKRHSEIYLKYCAEKYKLNISVVRPFNIYGRNQDERMVIPRFLNRARKNLPLNIYGKGDQTRDFTYVDDFINCLLKLKKNKGYNIFNIARGNQTSILKLAKMIIKLTNSKSKIRFKRTPKSIQEFQIKKRCGNSRKFFQKYNYRPNTNIKRGIESIINL
ncbi:NAD-dependent epimerase/dehydratase family protein [Candidatus Pelagibacter sp.]|nr:NAD-dependent epimerase/dehydratase family protein [Candidatus Pelagibacter sp.]